MTARRKGQVRQKRLSIVTDLARQGFACTLARTHRFLGSNARFENLGVPQRVDVRAELPTCRWQPYPSLGHN